MMPFTRLLLLCFSCLISVSLVSCQAKTSPTLDARAPATAPPVTQPLTSTEKVKFKLAEGKAAFDLKPQPDGAKWVDATNQEWLRLTIDATQKIKMKDRSDRVLGYVVPEAQSWKLKNADQRQELYQLRRQSDGDYKLETGADRLVYRIKVRNDGYEIQTADQKTLYKVKVKDGKRSLRSAAGQTVLYTKSEFAPAAIACFGFDVLSREQKAALAYTVNRSGG